MYVQVISRIRQVSSYFSEERTRAIALENLWCLAEPYSVKIKWFHVNGRINSESNSPENVIMRSARMAEALSAILPQLVPLNVKLAADIAPVRLLPHQKWIEKLLVHHPLLKQTGCLALSGYAESYAFCVSDTCVFHVAYYAWAFLREVNTNLLESVPTVLQCFEISEHMSVLRRLTENLQMPQQ